ncbi:MAG TPA: helix-turn-helix transcriptional regulator [Sphingomicrobium sp.]|nr:helix-turn-helix transcriptional regulator [Sphingomicrobium sp.]
MNNDLGELLSSSTFAEEALVVDVQSALHQAMENAGLSRADLARRMNVSKARVTQMFSDDCPNLTLRLVARAFHAVGEQIEISCRCTRNHEKQADHELVKQAVRASENVVFGDWEWTWETEAPLLTGEIRQEALEPQIIGRALQSAEVAWPERKSQRERRQRAEDWLVATRSSESDLMLAQAHG